MQQVVNQIINFFGTGFQWIANFFQTIWKWSFGEIFIVFQNQLPKFSTLPIWKQVLTVIVVAAIIYFLYYVLKDLAEAVKKILDAFVGLLQAIVKNLIPVLSAGGIAFAGSWAINNMTINWLP